MTGPEIRMEAEKNPTKDAEDHLDILKMMGREGGITEKKLAALVEHAENLQNEVTRLNLCIDGVQERYTEAEKLGLARITDGLVLEEKNVEWVVNNGGELGVKIGNQCFFMYKGRSLNYANSDDGAPDMLWRPVYKREFGETVTVPRVTAFCYDRGERDDDHGYTFGLGWQPFPDNPASDKEA